MAFASQKWSPQSLLGAATGRVLIGSPLRAKQRGPSPVRWGTPPGKALSVRWRTPRESRQAEGIQGKPRCFWKLQDEVTKWLNFLTEFWARVLKAVSFSFPPETTGGFWRPTIFPVWNWFPPFKPPPLPRWPRINAVVLESSRVKTRSWNFYSVSSPGVRYRTEKLRELSRRTGSMQLWVVL